MTDLGFYEKVVRPEKKSKASAGKIALIIIYAVAVISTIISMFTLGFLGGFIIICVLTLLLYLIVGTSDFEYEIAINESGTSELSLHDIVSIGLFNSSIKSSTRCR